MLPFESFLQGIKPAYFEVKSRLSPEVLDQLEKYPNHHRNENEIIFFQEEKMKDQFLEKTKGLLITNPMYHAILGKALGYPPFATMECN